VKVINDHLREEADALREVLVRVTGKLVVPVTASGELTVNAVMHIIGSLKGEVVGLRYEIAMIGSILDGLMRVFEVELEEDVFKAIIEAIQEKIEDVTQKFEAMEEDKGSVIKPASGRILKP